MALYGSNRDVSLFRRMSRELMGNIINQQCAFYKFILDKTITNMYGEASGGKFYNLPVLFNCLVDRNDQENPVSDLGVDTVWNVDFALLKDDLRDASLVPEVGDIIMYNETYYEVDNVISNQLFMGKDPDYPNDTNPLNSGLEKFGWDTSLICKTHLTPSDRINILKSRL